jgi:cell division protein FtsQ
VSGPASSPRRFPERAQARRWSRWKVALVLLGTAGLLAAAAWAVLESRLFAVRAVEVTGTSRLSAAQVVAAADVLEGTPLARVDTGAVAGRVRELPAVRTVDVVRRWPHRVQIVVRERAPAAVRPHGSSFSLVDRSGIAFDVVKARPAGLPLLSAPVDAGPEALRAALDVLAATPPAVRPQVVEVRAASPDHVTLRLTQGRTVVWGSPDRGDRKAEVLTALMTRRAKTYDVSAPDAPTTRT